MGNIISLTSNLALTFQLRRASRSTSAPRDISYQAVPRGRLGNHFPIGEVVDVLAPYPVHQLMLSRACVGDRELFEAALAIFTAPQRALVMMEGQYWWKHLPKSGVEETPISVNDANSFTLRADNVPAGKGRRLWRERLQYEGVELAVVRGEMRPIAPDQRRIVLSTLRERAHPLTPTIPV
ncbi:MAG: hypothetical protein HQ596_05960 [Candidatus Saganbacteria bacterium]|nr:hypothetical protein [Candidatus Saganbacteria bacterium]